MTKFNDFFKKDDERYIDIPIDTDIELYIDPSAVGKVTSKYFNSKIADQKIRDFFKRVFDLYLANNKEESLKLITEPAEINATHLGMSSGASKGNGPSKRILGNTFEKLVELAEKDIDLLRNPILIPLFVPEFGNDRFSDLLTCIIIKELCEFTSAVCEELDIPLSSKVKVFKYYDIETHSWIEADFLLPIGPDGEHIVLVPKSIVRKEYSFKAQSFVWKVIFRERQDYHLRNSTSLIQKKEVDGKMVAYPPVKNILYKEEVSSQFENNVIKQYALQQTLKSPHLLEQYVQIVEEQVDDEYSAE